MTAYLKARLTEHSSQVAIGADITAVVALLNGQITWQSCLAVAIGSIIPIFLPAA